MSETDRKNKPEAGAPQAAGNTEMQVRVVCAGKSAPAVLEELARGLDAARDADRDPLVVLEDLVLLQDSVSTLLKGICKILVAYPRTVTFWESSGYTEAFMTAMDAPIRPSHDPEPGGPPNLG
ncbi:MAG TPA: hypothetical protein VE981_12250 [Planctomycetota bacterium]|nr:hypothetical protein [Planctomycetota bacterium]